MKSYSIWWRTLSILALAAMLISPVSATTPAQASQVQDPPVLTQSDRPLPALEAVDYVDLDLAVPGKDGRVRLIVELSEPPLALYEGGVAGVPATSRQATGSTKLDINSPSAQAYIQHLKGVQDAAISAIQKLTPGASVDYRYQVGFNGFGVEVSPADALQLLKVPGVKAVYPDQMRYVELDASLDLINAPEMWAAVGGRANAGSGVFVAVVDTGIWPEHPMFAGTGFTMPSGYPRGYCLENPGDSFQCNSKLVSARYYEPTFAVHAAEVMSPRDINGHGSHTAGTAAGNVVVITDTKYVETPPATLSGVAPGAYLMAYKALFHTPEGNGSGTDTMLLAALEDALGDGADVINNSWGGGAGDPRTSVYRTLFESLIASNVVIVFSAGNSGPNSETIGCPGCVEHTIATAASTTNRRYSPAMTITSTVPLTSPLDAPVPYLAASSAPFTTTVTAPIKWAGTVNPANTNGCAAFPAGAFAGHIALIQRGACDFIVKVNNAAAAGAVAAIVYNNQGEGYVNMAVTGATIPAVFIRQSDGTALAEYLTANPGATVVGSLNPNQVYRYDVTPDVLATFSSVGPGGDPNFLKPDITAPGVDILSAYSPVLSGGLYAQISGTSMASPHIAGSVALMKELHPTWSVNQIRSVLMTTSVQTVLRPDGVTPATPFNMGAGRVDLERALNAGVTFDSASFSAGQCIRDCQWHNTIKNVTNTTKTWEAHIRIQEGVSIAVTPTVVTLPPNLAADFLVTVDVTRGLSDWHYGEIIWRDTSGVHPDAYMPIVITPQRFTDAAFTKDAPEEIVPGEAFTYTVELANTLPVTTTYFFYDKLPEEVVYVEDSAPASLEYNADDHSLSGQFTMGPVVLDLKSDQILSSFIMLKGNFGSPALPCSATCDETVVNFPGLDFMYNGVRYDTLSIFTNGFVVPGGWPAMLTDVNTPLPNPDSPNNMIAPLWTDIDMQGGTGGGLWYYNFLTDGVNEWLVIEWNEAQRYGVSTSRHTFQIWIMQGDQEEIFFTYNQITDNTVFTVGIENSTGTGGDTYYYNGAGTLPATGNAAPELYVDAQSPSVSFSFMVEPLPTLAKDTYIINQASVLRSGSAAEWVAWATTKLDWMEVFFPLMPAARRP